MQRLEVSGAVRPIYGSLGVKRLNVELNPICHLLALLGTHHILHVSRIRVNKCPVGLKFIPTIPWSPGVPSSVYVVDEKLFS